MYRVVLKARFRKDYARCARRGLPIAKVDAAIRLLASGATPPPAMLDHPLKGDNAGGGVAPEPTTNSASARNHSSASTAAAPRSVRGYSPLPRRLA